MSTFAPSRPFCLSCLLLAAVLLAGCAASVTGSGGGKVTTPPVPAGLSALAGNAEVSLSWAVARGATSYHVKRSSVSGGPYSQLGAPSAAAYLDASLTNGTKYFYVVSALNSSGESANSTEVNATPTAPASVPAVPANLAATAGNAQIALSWSTSTGATGYNVKRSAVSGGPYAQVAAPSTDSYTDTGLTNGTTYYYVVSGVNSAGQSANSTQASAIPAAPAGPPVTPANLTATAGNAQVSLSWSVSSGATSYNVERSTTSGGPYPQIAATSTNSYTDTGLTNGVTYYYVVSAVNSAGKSANSAQASATPTVPSNPDVIITLNPAQTHAISPYIYGINFYSGITGAPPDLTFDRAGGNRWTAYNWKPTPPMPAAITCTRTTTISAVAVFPPRPCAASLPATKPTVWPVSSRSRCRG